MSEFKNQIGSDIDIEKVDRFIKKYSKNDIRNELRSFIIIKNNKILFEYCKSPYNIKTPTHVFSVSKTLTALAVGLAENDGLLSVNDSISPYFLGEIENIDEFKNIKIKDLLTMSTGQIYDMFEENDYVTGIKDEWAKKFFSIPIKEKTGEFFKYNTGASYILSIIIQKITGELLVDYIYKNLLFKMGIDKPHWILSPEGYCAGGFGAFITLEDMVKLGLLFLNKGKWNNEQIISKDWLQKSSSLQCKTDNIELGDYAFGYGYQMWMGRGNTYKLDGAYGQFSIIFPNDNMVIAVTSSISDNTKMLEDIYDLLYKAVYSDKTELNSEIIDWNDYFTNSQNLEITPSLRRYKVDKDILGFNEVIIELNKDKLGFQIGQQKKIYFNYFEWSKTKTSIDIFDDNILVKGYWENEGKFKARIRYEKTPFIIDFDIIFYEDNRIMLNFSKNLLTPIAREYIGVLIEEIQL